jgi:ceramide glucosyltransferase
VLTAFYILVFQQILQGIYSIWDALQWLRFVRRRLATHPGFYAPRVAVICPCKGLEPGLEENLAAMAQFDYPDYELFFVLADAQDPARSLLDRVAAKSERRVHVVLAGRAKDCGEKVNNLRAAVDEAGDAFDVFVFTDSDVRAGRRWLAQLVAPLGNPKLGAATTFRWLMPSRGISKGNLWSAFAAAWNAAIVTMLGERKRNFCWGGGTAIRRITFEGIHVREFWRGAVSDDLALTRALEQSNLPIAFVPECLAPSFHDTDLRGLLEFTNRQIIITRVYAPRLWLLGLLAHLSYCGTVLFAAWVICARAFSGGLWFSLALVAFLIPLLAALKGAMRLAAVLEILPAWKDQLIAWNWAWILLAPLVPFLYLWNSIVAAFTRKIRWRGARYELVSRSQTRILTR